MLQYLLDMVGFFKQTIRDVPLDGKTVLMRADYNVPLTESGEVDDDFRIRASLPTLEYLLKTGCTVVIISHLGRPEGREDKYSLKPVAKRLQELLKRPITFVDDCVGDKVTTAVKKAPASSVLLLENLRFYKEEEANDEGFAKRLARDSQARYFVQDGFGVVHRAHASTAAITLQLPSVAGLLLEKEYMAITGAMNHPKRPLVAVLGGAKVSDKLPLIESLENVADKILIGGAMANTFLASRGVDMGKSVYEGDMAVEIEKIYRRTAEKPKDYLVLPSDVAVASHPDAHAKRRVVPVEQMGRNDMALDIGDETIEQFVRELAGAKTVIWNGTLGFAELPEFAHGSARIALAIATRPEVISIIGGGDTADFVLKWDAEKGGSFTHVSTGGGASLELMAGEKLPGVESLLDARK